MGVFLALGVFGIFGGGQILCEKGIQSQIGTVKTLQYTESDPGPSIPLLSDILDYFVPKTEHNRTVLVRPDASLVRLPYARFIPFEDYENKVVIVTGSYDACSQKLVVKDPSAIQVQ
ncbi:hypothetical protein CO051_06125 [Candidatus Roizmanbacteria bacterium CG_4_9_14_0_2_um_filter_39_13]|uniref:Uncharacterized protein n=1 Tax=Candidatus Roizmanbacteria bacterium CG_4_9_14_0_2_um_filter_39_13 TaxID=1974839 RepID=A0A2M8EWW6_9BACT|nr:MAG: hypothetical protein CO051_06125 [Candidatus Roizmanbacteria bacterium CG_4_9_14_0_2_um_filter_39_13]